MAIFNKNSFLKKDKLGKEKLQEIVDKLPSNEVICKEILKKYGNNTTKLKLDDDIKNSYYVFLNDTIYLSNKSKSKNTYYRLILIAHECRHVLQSKLLQKINFLLSNLELVFFAIFILLSFFNIMNIRLLIAYICFFIISLIPRIILEYDAVKNSINISMQYVEEKGYKNWSYLIEQEFGVKTKLLFPIMLVQLFFGKLLRCAILVLMYIIFNKK